ncbi:MAG: phosphoadenylyl-sulfate reductase [Sandaracinaceae bacterium]|nr:phosphoadenylyl-sulfate reductase [Sandaracinaceae bacterium]
MEALKLVRPAGELDLDRVNAELAGAGAEEVIAWALATFGESLVMSSSFGAQAALMLHLATRVAPRVRVIFLDTGYLFPETYQFAEALRERFDLRLEVYSPRITPARQEALFGRLYDGDEDDLRRYNQINKVEPMQRALRELGARAWLAGLRADQTEHRAGLRKVELQNGVYKVHPILDWTKADVKRYFELHDLPYHPLHAWGYRSIGDVHSTTPTTPDQDERDGRRLGEKRECGIHLPSTPEEEASLESSGL